MVINFLGGRGGGRSQLREVFNFRKGEEERGVCRSSVLCFFLPEKEKKERGGKEGSPLEPLLLPLAEKKKKGGGGVGGKRGEQDHVPDSLHISISMLSGKGRGGKKGEKAQIHAQGLMSGPKKKEKSMLFCIFAIFFAGRLLGEGKGGKGEGGWSARIPVKI